MRIRKSILTLCTLVSLLGFSQFGCKTPSALEKELQYYKEQDRELEKRNKQLQEKLTKSNKECNESQKRFSNLATKYNQLLPLKNRIGDLFKSGDRISRFKNPNGEDILLRMDVVDYMNSRAQPTYKKSDQELIEPKNKYILTLIQKLGLPTKNQEKDAQKILDFVQSIPYVEDKCPYTKTVTETLAENSGDCEDHAVLAVSMFRSININAELVTFFDLKKKAFVHEGSAVSGNFKGVYIIYQGKRYFYAETTGGSWEIGEYSEKLKNYFPLVGKSVTTTRASK